ncbi:MAG: ADP-glyceromanno-heptose 6-epimerase [Candidatus Cloacimonetes bacterium]|nr:ADP-glyceromanno-heptose 6-epimerase [Candidatus Cloacimonadota bacterium]
MIIVTGGAGFIGSAFIAKLNEEGISDIVIVDKLRSGEKWKNLVGKKYIDFIDKEDFWPLLDTGMFDSAEAVVHLGACSATTERDGDYLMDNNFYYSRELAEWALAKKIRFIYASSAAVYGDGKLGYSDADELTGKLKPLNMYGYSKQLMDNWVIDNELQDDVVGFRFFNVFGPNEYHKGNMMSVVAKSFKQVQESGRVTLFNSPNPDFEDGMQMRDFVYVKDVVEVIYWFLQNPQSNGIFNLGTGQANTFMDLVKAVFKALDKEAKIDIVEMPEELRGKYQYYTQAEMQKLVDAGCSIGFSSLEDSVADYVKNYLIEDLKHY